MLQGLAGQQLLLLLLEGQRKAVVSKSQNHLRGGGQAEKDIPTSSGKRKQPAQPSPHATLEGLQEVPTLQTGRERGQALKSQLKRWPSFHLPTCLLGHQQESHRGSLNHAHHPPLQGCPTAASCWIHRNCPIEGLARPGSPCIAQLRHRRASPAQHGPGAPPKASSSQARASPPASKAEDTPPASAVTWGGVGVDVGLTVGGVGFRLPPPDIISSVMSLPPWFGSRMRI